MPIIIKQGRGQTDPAYEAQEPQDPERQPLSVRKDNTGQERFETRILIGPSGLQPQPQTETTMAGTMGYSATECGLDTLQIDGAIAFGERLAPRGSVAQPAFIGIQVILQIDEIGGGPVRDLDGRALGTARVVFGMSWIHGLCLSLSAAKCRDHSCGRGPEHP
jgi:hypothetical protein